MTRYVLNFYVIKDGVFLEESAARFIKYDRRHIHDCIC